MNGLESGIQWDGASFTCWAVSEGSAALGGNVVGGKGGGGGCDVIFSLLVEHFEEIYEPTCNLCVPTAHTLQAKSLEAPTIWVSCGQYKQNVRDNWGK